MPISDAYAYTHVIGRACIYTLQDMPTHVTEHAYPPHTSYTHAYTYHMHMHTHVTGHAHKGSYNMHMHLGGDFEMLVRARRVKFVSLRFQEMAAHAHAYTHAIGP